MYIKLFTSLVFRSIQTFVLQSKLFIWIGIIVCIALTIFSISVSSSQCSWTGFGRCVETIPENTQVYPAKTLWDWLQLLIVPVFLSVGATFIARLEKTKEERASAKREALQLRLAQDQQSEDALQHFFEKITELLVSGNLKKSPIDPEPGSEGERIVRVNLAARGRTLALLRRLDGARKGQVIRFLEELHLIRTDNLVIPLSGADLQEAQLTGQHLENVYLRSVDLTNANLENTYLQGTVFDKAKMCGVNLSNAFLCETSLLQTDLCKAILRNVNLEGCIADGAKLIDASLSYVCFGELSDKQRNVVKRTAFPEADFSGATLGNVKFEGAWLPGARFHGARLSHVEFFRCDLSDTDFSEATLIDTSFRDCIGVDMMTHKPEVTD